jgi:hypothetical protein
MPNIITCVLMEIADEELHVGGCVSSNPKKEKKERRSMMNKLRILIRNSMGHHLEVPESSE